MRPQCLPAGNRNVLFKCDSGIDTEKVRELAHFHLLLQESLHHVSLDRCSVGVWGESTVHWSVAVYLWFVYWTTNRGGEEKR